MAKFSMGGKDYDLIFNVHAMKAMEHEFGDLSEGIEKFRKNRRNVHIVGQMFKIMANAGQWEKGEPEDVTEDAVDRLTLKGLDTLSRTLNLAMEESLHSETTGGNEADDEVHDVYLEQLEAQEKNG